MIPSLMTRKEMADKELLKSTLPFQFKAEIVRYKEDLTNKVESEVMFIDARRNKPVCEFTAGDCVFRPCYANGYSGFARFLVWQNLKAEHKANEIREIEQMDRDLGSEIITAMKEMKEQGILTKHLTEKDVAEYEEKKSNVIKK